MRPINWLRDICMLISEIYSKPKGARISGSYGIKSIDKNTARDGRYYLVIALSDKTGTIPLFYWGNTKEDSVSIYDSLEKNDVIAINDVLVDSWVSSDHRALKLEKTPGRITKVDKDQIDPADYIQDTKRSKDEMYEYVTQKKDEIEGPHLRSLMNKIFSDAGLMHKFKTAPASIMIHHAHASGLLEHTWEVLNYCEKITEIHSTLDKDLLYAGAILHDIGKINTYVASVTIDNSREGMLLEHLYLGCDIVTKYVSEIDDFPDILHNKLRHIILSHHGQPGMGAVVRPAIPEAAAIHYADMMGAQIVQYINAIESYEGSDFKTARRIFPLDTKMYVE